jgi:hypothetical protein
MWKCIVKGIVPLTPSKPATTIGIWSSFQTLVSPRVTLCSREYGVRFIEARASDPPLMIRNRPREIVFNTEHAALAKHGGDRALETVLTLELAYLLGGQRGADELHAAVLKLLS